MNLFLLSSEEANKLPEEILKCKALDSFNGWKDKEGYCYWWLRTPGMRNDIVASVYDGRVKINGDNVYYVYNAVRPALRLSDISALGRDEDGNIIYGKLPDGSDIKWIDISEYLGEPVLLMKECLPNSHRFNAESNDYETSEIKKYLASLEREMFSDDLGCCKNAPVGYNIDDCPYQKSGCKMQCKQEEADVQKDSKRFDAEEKSSINDIRVDDVQKFLNFLQTGAAEGYVFKRPLRLTPEQAFSVIYYLQEEMHVIPDTYEMCDECHRIYDTDEEGEVIKNKHFCDSCKYEEHHCCTINVGDRVEILDPTKLPDTDISGNSYETKEEHGECIGIDNKNYIIKLDDGVVISVERQYFIYAE